MNQREAPSSKARSLFFINGLLFFVIYMLLTVGFGYFAVDWSSVLGVVFFLGFEVLFVSVAYGLTELLMSAVLRPIDLPKLAPLSSYPPVALVMTVCDDTVPEALVRLGCQTYPNCDVFVLDDSVQESSGAVVNQLGYALVRRMTHDGFKAGNLNYWVERCGAQYKYLAVFDSDSLADEDFITRMVEYAEHPDNASVAIFQSRVLPWNTDSVFVRTLGAIAPARMQILKRTADRLGTVFCFGHNYLARMDSIRQVEGFPTYVTAEDTALTLLLSGLGYSVRLVDVVSYDTEPPNMFVYARRGIRWAKQTVEIFRFPWRHASVRLKLTLCYHLYSYLIGVAYAGLCLLSAWTFKPDGFTWDGFRTYVSVAFQDSPSLWLVSGIIVVWMLQWLSQVISAKVAGARLRYLLFHSLLTTPLMYSFIFRQTVEMLRTAAGANVVFRPTNRQETELHSPSFVHLVRYLALPLALGFTILLGMILRNRLLLYSPNSLWLLLLLSSPLILWWFCRTSPGTSYTLKNTGGAE